MDKAIFQGAFNPSGPTIMHIDLNSCFATIEQQANPLLRGKPVAVAAYTTPNGCILAPSIEAKRFGVKTGMRVREGKALCPDLIVLPPDPAKYRFVNRQLLALLREYSAEVEVKSIDEMVLNLDRSPVLEMKLKQIPYAHSGNRDNCYIVKLLYCQNKEKKQNNNISIQQYNNSVNKITVRAMLVIGREIKERIKVAIGEWLTASVGIAPNRFLAKTAASLHKPDGLDVITRDNIEEVLVKLELEGLCGIKEGLGSRLRQVGVDTAVKFYRADAKTLVSALHSVTGYDWWLRLHGWEDIHPRCESDTQKSFGQSYAFGKPYTNQENGLYQVLWQLVAKMGRRLRQDGAVASGIFVSCLFVDHTRWRQGKKMSLFLSTDFDFYQRLKILLAAAPRKPVRILAISCFHLNYLGKQESLFEEDRKKVHLMHTIDAIHDRWGDGLITSGRVLGTAQPVIDRIAFGSIREL